MRVNARPKRQLLDELYRNSEAFRQPIEYMLGNAPLLVAHLWMTYRNLGSLPGVFLEGNFYCIPMEFVEDYRGHWFALQFTQAFQTHPPGPSRSSEENEIEVDDRVLDRLASFVGATSLVEAYGYALCFFNRILNLAREDYPGGMPGYYSTEHNRVFAFFPMEVIRGYIAMIGWEECRAASEKRLAELRAGAAGSSIRGPRPQADSFTPGNGRSPDHGAG